MLLLDELVTYLPIADIPEHIISIYLPGDKCLDHCRTIDLVFKHGYKRIEQSSFVCTYLDPGFTVPHSFNDEPAIIDYENKESYKQWFHNGKCHRDNDQPAIVYLEMKEWFHHGKVHRDNDEPAIIGPDGYKEWYNHGKRHRENDEPAVIMDPGHKEWWKDGKRYRHNDEQWY